MFFYFLFTHYTYTLYQQPGTQEDTIMTGLNVPGTSFQAYATLPLRVLLAGMLFSMSYPLVLLLALLRAIYLRAAHGAPSQILKKGTFNNVHKSASNHVYPSHIILAAPVDQVGTLALHKYKYIIYLYPQLVSLAQPIRKLPTCLPPAPIPHLPTHTRTHARAQGKDAAHPGDACCRRWGGVGPS